MSCSGKNESETFTMTHIKVWMSENMAWPLCITKQSISLITDKLLCCSGQCYWRNSNSQRHLEKQGYIHIAKLKKFNMLFSPLNVTQIRLCRVLWHTECRVFPNHISVTFMCGPTSYCMSYQLTPFNVTGNDQSEIHVSFCRTMDQSKQAFTPDTVEIGLTPKTEIKEQPAEACWSTFVDPTLERREMTAKYPDQAQS